MSSVIKVENLGKRYIIGHQRQDSYVSLRDVIANKFKAFGKKDHFVSQEEFWALRGVSFELKQGDRVGIIGRNGAGKSTLLKILSRITEPTTGKIAIKGRVASLLEVGTGFHPELTGRENIFLNGAILGMSRVDIKKNFDEIVAFAEVEKFLDTPVKRYSSGMYVRLAFAVAAHLETEILIVDEVLAVGDVEFQQKCLGKMNHISSQGRSVLFVSHNMAAITFLCKKALLLDQGSLLNIGNVDFIVNEYVHTNINKEMMNIKLLDKVRRPGNGDTFLTKIELFDPKNKHILLNALTGKALGIRIYYDSISNYKNILKNLNIGIQILSKYKNIVTILNSRQASGNFYNIKKIGIVECIIPKLALMPGVYTLKISIHVDNHLTDRIEDGINVRVYQGDYFGFGVYYSHQKDAVFMNHYWGIA